MFPFLNAWNGYLYIYFNDFNDFNIVNHKGFKFYLCREAAFYENKINPPRHGNFVWKNWDRYGFKTLHCEYKDGKKHGNFVYQSNSKYYGTCTYDYYNCFKHYFDRHYVIETSLTLDNPFDIIKATHVNGEVHGDVVNYSGSSITAIMQYKYGKREGKYIEFDSYGRVVVEENYENGVKISEKKWA